MTTNVELAWAGVGVAAGVLIGSALRGTAFRLSVPSGEPPRTTCPRCATPLPRRLPIRCRCCRSRLGTPLALELATAAVLALLLGRFGGQPDVVAFCYLGALGVSLAAIDLSVHRWRRGSGRSDHEHGTRVGRGGRGGRRSDWQRTPGHGVSAVGAIR